MQPMGLPVGTRSRASRPARSPGMIQLSQAMRRVLPIRLDLGGQPSVALGTLVVSLVP